MTRLAFKLYKHYCTPTCTQARTNSTRERLSKAEANLGRALEVEGLRSTVDEAQAAREAARAEATKTRLEMQVTSAREKCLVARETVNAPRIVA